MSNGSEPWGTKFFALCGAILGMIVGLVHAYDHAFFRPSALGEINHVQARTILCPVIGAVLLAAESAIRNRLKQRS
jgi:uncharacterized membrane protein YeaQ/YmgE (transglycosylase-associated protein family)